MSTDTVIKQPLPGNPVVFLDFRVDREQVGRMVIELRKDVVPKTAENFRRICIGDFHSQALGRPLTYTGTNIHRVQRMFAICGGTIGDVGESIYGPTFPDENFELMHKMGAVSMSNSGPDTNNSQFFITRTECPNLDGTHVVFGNVLRGLDILAEMEKVTTEDGTPTAEITIVNSGELDAEKPSSWLYYDLDDNCPPFPADWAEPQQCTLLPPEDFVAMLERIKFMGNEFYRVQDVTGALRKYKKVGRYHQFFVDAHAKADQQIDAATTEILAKLRLNNLQNMAACQLKLGQYRHVVSVCDEVLRSHPGQSKAHYRRGVALIELKDYENALEDLKQAHALMPNDPKILGEFNRGKELLMAYRKEERAISQKMFKAMNL